ncbi:MAG: winged helix-turn-helix domain-containing protein [Anaerolineae bacterium]
MKSVQNPFFHRGPIRQREYFFNRQREVSQVLGLLRNLQNAALVGPRRVGKTSLLFHLADPAIHADHGLSLDEYVFAYLDGEELTELDADQIRRAMMEELVAALGAGGHEVPSVVLPEGPLGYRAFRQAVRQLTQRGLKLIFCFDEFECLGANPHLGPGFFSSLRGLAGQFDAAYVTASKTLIQALTYAHAETLSSPFFNTFAHLHLGLFLDDDAQGLIEQLAAKAGVPLPSELIHFIVELAGPHPLLLQIAGFHAFELWQVRGEKWEEGDCDHLRRRFLAEAESHLEYYWRHLTDGDRYTLAALPLTQEDEARREAIRRLEQACLIRRTDQGYIYLSPVFENFVRRQSVPHLLQLGPFLLDLPRQTALCHHTPLKVTKTEFKALAHLIRRAGQVVTPEELEKALWGDEYVEDPERVRAVIKSLRKALGNEAECLVTKWGVGYMFQISS